MNAEIVTIELDPRQWAAHQAWISSDVERQAGQRRWYDALAEAMHPDNSVIVPAAGVWICHGVVEYGEFTTEEISAGWPDDAIRRVCPPRPVIGWRVTTLKVGLAAAGTTPGIVLVDGEFAGNFTESAFGDSPEAAIAEARRQLAVDREHWTTVAQQCENAGHRLATVQQGPDHMACQCTQHQVRFIPRPAAA